MVSKSASCTWILQVHGVLIGLSLNADVLPMQAYAHIISTQGDDPQFTILYADDITSEGCFT